MTVPTDRVALDARFRWKWAPPLKTALKEARAWVRFMLRAIWWGERWQEGRIVVRAPRALPEKESWSIPGGKQK
jgi:hypothetical protein